jgi:hypothetical protein
VTIVTPPTSDAPVAPATAPATRTPTPTTSTAPATTANQSPNPLAPGAITATPSPTVTATPTPQPRVSSTVPAPGADLQVGTHIVYYDGPLTTLSTLTNQMAGRFTEISYLVPGALNPVTYRPGDPGAESLIVAPGTYVRVTLIAPVRLHW